MSKAEQPAENARYWEIDALRGVAMLLMTAFHLTWDLVYYGMVNVNMGDGDIAIFEGQMIISGIGGQFSAGGDSGSLILDKQRRAVGLLFAGNDSITIGNDIHNVLEALDIRFIK